jgi:Fungal Zn(2)-Cys(6) binuclear cluster domain
MASANGEVEDKQKGNRRVTQACEACKRRKVRCNGDAPCHQCQHFKLSCIYKIVKRGRPRKNAAARGTVIEECRTGAPFTLNKSDPNATTLQGRYTKEFFMDMIPNYRTNVYPVNPVITESEIEQLANRFEANPADNEAASFLYAFAAVTINLTRTQSAKETRAQISELLNRSISQIEPTGLTPDPTIFKVMRGIFIQICLMGLRKPTLGLYYLRDAISMLYLLCVDKPEVVDKIPAFERARLQRAYWECFVHERFTALTQYKPICLRPLYTLPEEDPTLDPTIAQGWNNIIQTFLLVDFDFVDYWVNESPSNQLTAEWIETKHKQLADEQWMFEVKKLSNLQQADLIITRQWLRSLTWELAIKNTLLSSTPKSESLSLALPLRLSRDLRQFLEKMQFSREAVGIHGTGILHKLFEITYNIANVIINLPNARTIDTINRVEDILFLKRFIFSFPRIDDMQRNMLKEQFEKIQSMYPDIAEVDQLLNSPASMVDSPVTIQDYRFDGL